jgi:3-dehydroquinate synthase
MTIVPVPLGSRRYDVHIGSFRPEDIARHVATALGKTTGVAVFVDGKVASASPLVGDLLEALTGALPNVARYDLPAGEACKTFAQLERSCEWLAENGFDRGAALIGIGGGATGDHVGFAASVYLRGVPFALVPTTLLAMVDASVGGKTAVDLKAGKNLVGAFHQPKVVVAAVEFLGSLPARERRAGLAEVVKCGFIEDAALLARLESAAASHGDVPPELVEGIIAAAVKVKADVVTEDEKEGGRRAILNFGHTIGHAIEAASGYDLLHGEAVSLGMVAALALGESLGVTAPGLVQRARVLLAGLGLPVDFETWVTPSVLARIDVDKKRLGQDVKFVFVPEPGRAVIRPVPLDEVRRRVGALGGRER